MKTKIQKWGNSLGLRIPKSLAEQADFNEGTTVEISVTDNTLTVKTIAPASYQLEELLKQVTGDNLHGEVSTGSRKGKEAW